MFGAKCPVIVQQLETSILIELRFYVTFDTKQVMVRVSIKVTLMTHADLCCGLLLRNLLQQQKSICNNAKMQR